MKMRHAICQSNFGVRCEMVHSLNEVSKDMTDRVISVFTSVHWILQTEEKTLISEAKATIMATKVLGTPLPDFIKEEKLNNKSIKQRFV